MESCEGISYCKICWLRCIWYKGIIQLSELQLSSSFVLSHSFVSMCYYFFRGDFGRLGHGNSSDLFTPQPIKALHGLRIRQIACGDSHCLAVTMEGQVQRLVSFPKVPPPALFCLF